VSRDRRRSAHYSTDYVFDGKKDGFYTQRDQPAPESTYGLSKLEGERRAQLAHARTIVVRTGFVSVLLAPIPEYDH